jgi:hypothetical protein
MMMNTKPTMKSNIVSVLNEFVNFCLLQISVPTNGDDAMSDMENFSTTSSIISQIENGPDKLINNKRLLCNQVLGFFSSVDENRTKDEPIDFAMDTT